MQLQEPYLEGMERDSVEGSLGNTRTLCLLQQTIGQMLRSAGEGDTQWELEGSGWIISEWAARLLRESVGTRLWQLTLLSA